MSRKLLIVTGYPELGDVLQDRFQALGHQVLLSPVDLVSQRMPQWGRPDVMLWDLPHAEHRSGEAGELLHLLGSLKPRPPILYLLPENAPEWSRQGDPDLFLRRPVDFETVADALEHLLEKVAAASPSQERLQLSPPLPAEVSLLDPGRAQVSRQAVWVSSLDLAGASLQCPIDYTQGTRIRLWLKVPGEAQPLKLQAHVLESRRESDYALVDCSFQAVPYADLDRLEKILAQATDL